MDMDLKLAYDEVFDILDFSNAVTGESLPVTKREDGRIEFIRGDSEYVISIERKNS